MLFFLPEDKMNYICEKCKLAGLLEKVWSWGENISSFQEIKEGKKSINRSLWCPALARWDQSKEQQYGWLP